jgi:micrococcal nuclease
LFIVVPAFLLSLAVPGSATAPSEAFSSRVTHVSDGDTAYMTNLDFGTTAASWSGRKARFIGVDTPEVYGSSECYGQKASNFTKRKLDGQSIKVTYDIEKEDPYDRALVYIWKKGRLFNAVLVRKGYATVTIYEPNDLYEARLLRAERDARDANRGLWGACS